MNSRFDFIKYGILAAAFLLGGCMQDGDTLACDPLIQNNFIKVLTPADPDFYLSTDVDSAIANSSCKVGATFKLAFGFHNDSLRVAEYSSHNAGDIPLEGLQAMSLFHVDDDSLILNSDWTISENSFDPSDTNPRRYDRYQLSATGYGSHSGMSATGHVNYYIKTRLLPSVHSIDSSVWVSGQIFYYAGGGR